MLGVQKKKKSLRTKIILVSEDEEENEPISKNTQPQFVSKSINTVSLLSFGDEDGEEEVFKLKKSQKIKLEDNSYNVYNEPQSISEYQYEKPENNGHSLTSKNHIKPKSLKSKKNKAIVSFSEETIVQENKEEGLKSLLEAGDIPTAAQIHAARKQRQYVRESYGDEDLPTNKSPEPSDDPHHSVRHLMDNDATTFKDNKSRLIREDDNDLSETELDTYEGRTEATYLSMSTIMEKESSSKYQSKKELLSYLDRKEKLQQDHSSNQAILSDEYERDTDDEEFEKWEREQIMKGANIPQSQRYAQNLTEVIREGNATASNKHHYPAVQPVKKINWAQPPAFVQDGGHLALGDESMNGVNCEQVRREIENRIETLISNLSVHRMDLNATRENQAGNGVFLQLLNEETDSIGDDFKFYQSFKTYIEDLIECHNEKAALVNSLEARIHNLSKQRATRLATRRLQDLKDESEEYSLVQMMGASKGSKVYEPNENAKRRIAEREARRGRRRRARESTRNDECVRSHNEGMSTDDEETRTESTTFVSQQSTLYQEAAKVFDDTLEDYHELDKILERFAGWKSSHADTYREAFVNLCLVRICENTLRHSLLTHDLCQEKYKLADEPWFVSLLRYCGSSEGKIINLKEEEDDRLVIIPNLIANVFLPKLTYFVQNVYDPLSSLQTANVVALVEEIADAYPFFTAEDHRVQEFYKNIQERFIKSLENDIYLPVYPSNLMENKNSGVVNYHNRQFWTCIKLMENIIKWRNLFSEQLTKELAFDGILNRYIILAFQNSPLNKNVYEKCLRIGRNIKHLNTIDEKGEIMMEFQPFWRYLNYLEEKIGATSSSAIETDFYPYDKEEILDSLSQMIQWIARKRKNK